jgi:hypothetical protein
VNARDELFEAMMPTYETQYAPGEADAVNALIDNFAHELAEKIRNCIGKDDYPYESDRARNITLGFRMAAVVIDPEVSK